MTPSFDNARHISPRYVRIAIDELSQLIKFLEQRIALLERELEQRS
jgi:uncharacterized small protein (DUF1192 family)